MYDRELVIDILRQIDNAIDKVLYRFILSGNTWKEADMVKRSQQARTRIPVLCDFFGNPVDGDVSVKDNTIDTTLLPWQIMTLKIKIPQD